MMDRWRKRAYRQHDGYSNWWILLHL